MAAPDEIRSTEKLLELIRKPSQGQPTEAAPPPSNPPSAARRLDLVAAFRRKKEYVVGVDIGHTYIRMAKTLRTGDMRYELLDYLHIPLDTQSVLHDTRFLERLKDGLNRLCGKATPCTIWSAIPSAQVEVRHLRIPKLKRSQVDNAVFWTFNNKVAFDPDSEILDYEVLGEITEAGVRKMAVVAFKAPKNEIAALQTTFERIGYPLDGISIVPFAVQNLFRTRVIDHAEQDVCCLFVGRDWSRIAIYNHNNLVISRGIKAGMRSMVEAIHLATVHPEDNREASFDLVPREDDAPAPTATAIHPDAQKLFFEFIGNTVSTTAPNESRTDDAEGPQRVFQMLLPAMARLVRQVERSLEHYLLHFQSDGVKRIYLSGQISANTMLVRHIGQQLELPVEVMNPFTPGPSLKHDVAIPETRSEREAFLPAIGLALSHNSLTPNMMYTHKHKASQERLRRFNQRVLIGCMACLLALLFVFSWQERRLEQKREHIARMHHQLATFSPPAEKNILLALFSKSQAQQQTLAQIIQRYAPMALINELADITPAHVRLIRVEMAPQPPTRQGSAAAVRTLSVDGVIFADPAASETALTSYLLALRNSPLFAKPVVQNRRVEYYDDREVLRFQATLEVP